MSLGARYSYKIIYSFGFRTRVTLKSLVWWPTSGVSPGSLKESRGAHSTLALLVDDVTLKKKGGNLYEPVLIYLPDRPQPLELVANQITRGGVKGYLSEPRYKKSEGWPRRRRR